MKLTLHRGAREIGGSCVELTSNSGARLILDLGMPLSNADGTAFDMDHELSAVAARAAGVLPAIDGFYNDQTPGQRIALAVSHAHQDHYGLAGFLHPSVPVFMSGGTQKIMEVMRVFLSKPIVWSNVHLLRRHIPSPFDDFTITPYPACHSAADALSFLIEADGKRVFYTGDLRAHGRKGFHFDNLLEHPPKDIDLTLMEGTTLGRDTVPAYPDETAVEEKLVNRFAGKTQAALLFCSGQNIDRIVSVYRAAKRTGQTLVIDLYTAYVLDQLGCLSDRLPQGTWPGVRVLYWHHHAQALADSELGRFFGKMKSARIDIDELAPMADRLVILARSNRTFRSLEKRLLHAKIQVIWSMWQGYWKTDRWVRPCCEANGIVPEFIHAGGHAGVSDLQRLVSALKPKRLVPIHTQRPEEYERHFRDCVVTRVGDKETVAI